MTDTASTPASKPLLSGHIALITGATGGIGKATARLLASLGASVALQYNSDQAGADQLQNELTREYQERFESRFDGWKADLGDYDDVCNPWPWLHSKDYHEGKLPTYHVNTVH
jgi:3-oxoacyl-[acyl-carrier protein] reductase